MGRLSLSKFSFIKPASILWQSGQPYSSDFSDIYFSSAHGLEESKHVYISGNQLIERWSSLTFKDNSKFVIGETGFGTGLNFLLAWSLWEKTAPKNARLHFISCEKHPLLLQDLERCLALWPELSAYAEAFVAQYPVLTPGFHHLEFADGRVTLNLMLGDALVCYQELLMCGDPLVESTLQHGHVDAWFLDGFSPKKNPDMWSDKLMAVVSNLSKKGTTLSTFSAAALVKSSLLSSGFDVSKQQGYGQKRDMVIAHWQHLPAGILKRQTPWHISRPYTVKRKNAIVIGAGLAGCCTAYKLAKLGWNVTLLEAQSKIAEGASGVPRAVLFPNLSAYMSPLTKLMLSGFLYAYDFYLDCLKKWPVGDLSGLIQFSGRDEISDELRIWLEKNPTLGRMVSKTEASDLLGVKVHQNAIFVPKAGWINTKLLCEQFVQEPGIKLFLNTPIHSLEYESGAWHIAGHQAEVVVVASGYHANQFSQTQYLKLQPVRGQVTIIQMENNDHSEILTMPACGDGHVVPYQNGSYLIGASFIPGSEDLVCNLTDDNDNLSKIRQLPLDLRLSQHILRNWVGVRGATLDHLPFVGPVADAQRFIEQFKSLETDSKRWIPSYGEAYFPGLYLISGFASRGLTTIPLCAEHLVQMINQGCGVIETSLSKAISPGRGLYRSIFR